MNSNLFEMTVCVNGRPVREYGHKGLTFVEGRKNQPYTLKFRNNTAKRVLAVISVDGLSVVDGKPAENESRGYVIPAYQAVEIKGWRESLEQVADFVFDTKTKAVSTQAQGEDTNCGVIAVKVFDEKATESDLNDFFRKLSQPVEHHHHHWPRIIDYPRPYYPPVYPHWGTPIYCKTTMTSSGGEPTAGSNTSLGANVTAMNMSSLMPPSDTLQASYSAAQENPDFNLGTGWGETREDKINETSFDRGTELACFSVYYSDSEGLKAAGIEVNKQPAVSKSVLPKGFNGFCKPPKVTST